MCLGAESIRYWKLPVSAGIAGLTGAALYKLNQKNIRTHGSIFISWSRTSSCVGPICIYASRSIQFIKKQPVAFCHRRWTWRILLPFPFRLLPSLDAMTIFYKGTASIVYNHLGDHSDSKVLNVASDFIHDNADLLIRATHEGANVASWFVRAKNGDIDWNAAYNTLASYYRAATSYITE